MTRRADTLLVTAGRDPGASFDFVNPPLVRGSTVLHESVADMKARIASRNAGADLPVTYGIYGTPTHHAFYEALNALEGGHASWALPSGLTACTVPILAFVQQGDHVLVPDSVYWPTRRFCRDTLTRYGVETTFYDPRIGERGRAAVEALFRPTTRVMFLESPGSLTFEMQDVPLLAEIARARGAVSMIDNTWATPLYCQPLALGVDVSIHAATKYICGHSDVILGTVTSNEAAWPRLRETFHHYGLTTSPDDVYLAHRGLHSMAARLRQHTATAMRLIEWLQAQPEVARILYPALPSDPGHALWKRDMSGASGLFGIVLKQVADERFVAFIDGLQLFGRGYSWGGYESLLIPVFPERTALPLKFEGPLFRIAAGLENADDLIADLAAGFDRLRA
ncbi:MAG TPA: cystathionine beta-lyase [Burkholderiaceae bacterium]|nr:cystathionine beta-lyase [Burkholderiaceae bacterium]